MIGQAGLLRAKLSPPRPYRLTLVQAGAGYGKTTALASLWRQLHEASPRPGAVSDAPAQSQPVDNEESPMPTICVNDIDLYYELYGDGEPLMLIVEGSHSFGEVRDASPSTPVACETLEAEDIAALLFTGGTTILTRQFDPAQVLDLIGRYKVTVFGGVPTMYQMMTQAPNWESADLSSLRFCMSGGAPLPVPLVRKHGPFAAHREAGGVAGRVPGNGSLIASLWWLPAAARAAMDL